MLILGKVGGGGGYPLLNPYLGVHNQWLYYVLLCVCGDAPTFGGTLPTPTLVNIDESRDGVITMTGAHVQWRVSRGGGGGEYKFIGAINVYTQRRIGISISFV